MQIWENDQISIRVDHREKSITLETNSSGFMPTYVTVHLSEPELDELIKALQTAKLSLGKK